VGDVAGDPAPLLAGVILRGEARHRTGFRPPLMARPRDLVMLEWAVLTGIHPLTTDGSADSPDSAGWRSGPGFRQPPGQARPSSAAAGPFRQSLRRRGGAPVGRPRTFRSGPRDPCGVRLLVPGFRGGRHAQPGRSRPGPDPLARGRDAGGLGAPPGSGDRHPIPSGWIGDSTSLNPARFHRCLEMVADLAH
jgi:hypothetical protein